MSLWVSCSTCHDCFPAETHAGLVRCEACMDRSIPRIDGRGPSVVEFVDANHAVALVVA